MKILAIASAASGSILTHTLISYLQKSKHKISLIATNTAKQISQDECGYLFNIYSKKVKCYFDNSFYAPPASGSTFDYDALVVIPASMGFLSRVSVGTSSTLSERAFDVALKEGKKIIVVPREKPFSIIHLETLLKLAKLGVVICPACPSYYNSPKSVQDMTNDTVGTVLRLLGLENNLSKKWKI